MGVESVGADTFASIRPSVSSILVTIWWTAFRWSSSWVRSSWMYWASCPNARCMVSIRSSLILLISSSVRTLSFVRRISAGLSRLVWRVV